MAVGRPRIYNSVVQLEKNCDAYFEECDEKKIRPTVTGLALFLGFADKTTLYEYRDREGFSYPIKKSLTRIEHALETKLDGQAVAGVIFALKNMGWKDKVETGFTDSQGKDTQPVFQLIAASGCEPIKTDDAE